MTKLPEICALWIGGQLSYMEQLCLQSFLDHGHKVTLYTYEGVKRIPDGVDLEDANNISPFREELRHLRTGSPALMSDVFRYDLLKKRPGVIWADTDAYCVKPFRSTTGFFLGWESAHHVNGGVLGLPADSKTLNGLLDLCLDPYGTPPWFSGSPRAKYEEAAKAGNPVHVSEMPWGVWGPHAITHFLKITGEVEHAFPTEALYPVGFAERRAFFKRPQQVWSRCTENTFSVHLYGRRVRARLKSLPEMLPEEGCYIDYLLKLHKIDPRQAPFENEDSK